MGSGTTENLYEQDTRFVIALNSLLPWEGGYNKHPNDPGGATNFGISLRFLKTIDADADEQTIMNMKKAQAAEIYYKHFWRANNYDDLHITVAKPLFNFAVNMGSKRANKLFQRAIMAATCKDLEQDGIIGPKTKALLEEADLNSVAAALRSEAAGRYRWLALADKKNEVFLTGWLRRAYKA